MSSDPEELGWLVKLIQLGHHRALEKHLSRLGLTLVQWRALREIERNPGGSQHLLAERTSNSDQAFGALANRMVTAGFVQRHQSSGRAISLVLTPVGSKLLSEGQKVIHEILLASFQGLTVSEREDLFRLLGKVLESMPNLEF